MAINDKDFVKFWPDFTLEHIPDGTNSLLSLYEIDELAFTFFISNLLDVLSIPKNLPYVMDDSVTNSILKIIDFGSHWIKDLYQSKISELDEIHSYLIIKHLTSINVDRPPRVARLTFYSYSFCCKQLNTLAPAP